jgi:hypothetical protein
VSKWKWYLNPTALLREIPRQVAESGYRATICGIHASLWTKLNTEPLKSLISEKDLEELNGWLETAFLMGKRMDYRLRRYHAKEIGSKAAALKASMKGEFVSEVPKSEWAK